MRIYANCYELMSEIFREVWEMGHIVHPYSMQNKIVKEDEGFSTKEITNYQYCLTKLYKVDYLFFADPKAKVWAEEELSERVMSPTMFKNPGFAWKIRKYIWEQFLNESGEFDYTYNERISISLRKVIEELKTNPDSRQAIIPIFRPEDIQNIGGKKRIPCSMYYQLLVRKNQLNIIYNQRSADVVTHFGNDVFLAYKLMEYIATEIGIKPGYLFHNIGSLHAYKKDWGTLKQCINDIKIG